MLAFRLSNASLVSGWLSRTKPDIKLKSSHFKSHRINSSMFSPPPPLRVFSCVRWRCWHHLWQRWAGVEHEKKCFCSRCIKMDQRHRGKKEKCGGWDPLRPDHDHCDAYGGTLGRLQTTNCFLMQQGRENWHCCFQIQQRQTNNVWPAGIMRLEHLCPIDLNVKSANGWRNLLF